MPDYCKNCGAKITENDQFCPDCGKQLQKATQNFCPNCGEKLENNPKFCASCGHQIKSTPQKVKTSNTFFEKYKGMIIIGAAILVLAVIAIAVSNVSVYEVQEVQVDTFSFEIPGTFQEDTYNSLNENDNGLVTKSKFWEDGGDFIQIDVMYSTKTYVDANKVNDGLGGQKENRYGYDGYYNDESGLYSFSFVRDNKLCTIYTTNYDLLDSVEVL